MLLNKYFASLKDAETDPKQDEVSNGDNNNLEEFLVDDDLAMDSGVDTQLVLEMEQLKLEHLKLQEAQLKCRQRMLLLNCKGENMVQKAATTRSILPDGRIVVQNNNDRLEHGDTYSSPSGDSRTLTCSCEQLAWNESSNSSTPSTCFVTCKDRTDNLNYNCRCVANSSSVDFKNTNYYSKSKKISDTKTYSKTIEKTDSKVRNSIMYDLDYESLGGCDDETDRLTKLRTVDYMDIVDDDMKLVIALSDYPISKIKLKHMQLFQKSLNDIKDMQFNENLLMCNPMFIDYYIKNGAIVCICKNVETRDWMVMIFPGLEERMTKKLVLLKAKVKRISMGILTMTKSSKPASAEDTFKLLQYFNPTLKTYLWRIFSRREVNDVEYISFYIDRISCEIMRGRDFKNIINLNLMDIDLRVGIELYYENYLSDGEDNYSSISSRVKLLKELKSNKNTPRTESDIKDISDENEVNTDETTVQENILIKERKKCENKIDPQKILVDALIKTADDQKSKQIQASRTADDQKSKQSQASKTADDQKSKQSQASKTADDQKSKQSQASKTADDQKSKQSQASKTADDQKSKQSQASKTTDDQKSKQSQASKTADDQKSKQSQASKTADDQKSKQSQASKTADDQKPKQSQASKTADDQKSNQNQAIKTADDQKSNQSQASKTADDQKSKQSQESVSSNSDKIDSEVKHIDASTSTVELSERIESIVESNDNSVVQNSFFNIDGAKGMLYNRRTNYLHVKDELKTAIVLEGYPEDKLGGLAIKRLKHLFKDRLNKDVKLQRFKDTKIPKFHDVYLSNGAAIYICDSLETKNYLHELLPRFVNSTGFRLIFRDVKDLVRYTRIVMKLPLQLPSTVESRDILNALKLKYPTVNVDCWKCYSDVVGKRKREFGVDPDSLEVIKNPNFELTYKDEVVSFQIIDRLKNKEKEEILSCKDGNAIKLQTSGIYCPIDSHITSVPLTSLRKTHYSDLIEDDLKIYVGPVDYPLTRLTENDYCALKETIEFIILDMYNESNDSVPKFYDIYLFDGVIFIICKDMQSKHFIEENIASINSKMQMNLKSTEFRGCVGIITMEARTDRNTDEIIAILQEQNQRLRTKFWRKIKTARNENKLEAVLQIDKLSALVVTSKDFNGKVDDYEVEFNLGYLETVLKPELSLQKLIKVKNVNETMLSDVPKNVLSEVNLNLKVSNNVTDKCNLSYIDKENKGNYASNVSKDRKKSKDDNVQICGM